MKEGFIIMNLSKHKRWRAHSDCKTIKKRTDLSVCLYAAEKYEKVESINTQNDYETASKK